MKLGRYRGDQKGNGNKEHDTYLLWKKWGISLLILHQYNLANDSFNLSKQLKNLLTKTYEIYKPYKWRRNIDSTITKKIIYTINKRYMRLNIIII